MCEIFLQARRSHCFCYFFSFLFSLASNAQQNANTIDPKTYSGMKWRLIGPFRGGRVLAVTGVSSQPNTYYFGAVVGGVWKTTDGGVTWDPCSDLSGPRVEVRKVEESRFPSSPEPENTAGLHIQYRELEPEVIQSTST